MKVAQYEVLGWRSERVARPGWDDRLAVSACEAVCERRGDKRFDRPCRDGHFLFASFSEHFVLGFSHQSRPDAPLFFR
jgi:hypothetical protein